MFRVNVTAERQMMACRAASKTTTLHPNVGVNLPNPNRGISRLLLIKNECEIPEMRVNTRTRYTTSLLYKQICLIFLNKGDASMGLQSSYGIAILEHLALVYAMRDMLKYKIVHSITYNATFCGCWSNDGQNCRD